MRAYLQSNVQEYGPEEINAVQSTPAEFGMKAFTVKTAAAVKSHATWRGMDVEWMFDRDFSAL